jgi:hypothetical protein
MSLDTDEIRDLREGKLTIDALHMELRRFGTSDVVYSGPGQIRQTAEGTIDYVLFDAQTSAEPDFIKLPLPGSWVPPESRFSLYARDWKKREWNATYVDTNTLRVRGEPGVVCSGEIPEITLSFEPSRTTGEFISLFVPDANPIPFNLITRIETDSGGRKSYQFQYNVWEIEGPDYNVRIVQRDNGLEVEARRDGGVFPQFFDSRLLEALWFVLARPIDWEIRKRSNTEMSALTIRRRPLPVPSPRLGAPLEFKNVIEAAGPCGDLLLKYLDYISDFKEARFHPTSVNIRQTLLASATNIETEALALGIAVESVIRREFKDLDKPEDTVLTAVDAALVYWENWVGAPDIGERVRTAIHRLKDPNPRESMNKLVASGILSDQHRDAWNKVRHTTAHGMSFNAPFRQIVGWCNHTYAALIRLIFSRIGYRGPYTDRAEGWPSVQFPGGSE